MSQPDTTKELHKILPPANNWVKLTQQGHDELTQQLESYINNKVKEARIDELSHVWYDDRLGLVLAHGTGINDRIQQLNSASKELEK